jgi:hypothetical protein
MHRALADLPLLGKELFASLSVLVGVEEEGRALICENKAETIEKISAMFIRELERQGLSSVQSDFLLEHGYAVQRGICDKAIRDIDALLG